MAKKKNSAPKSNGCRQGCLKWFGIGVSLLFGLSFLGAILNPDSRNASTTRQSAVVATIEQRVAPTVIAANTLEPPQLTRTAVSNSVAQVATTTLRTTATVASVTVTVPPTATALPTHTPEPTKTPSPQLMYVYSNQNVNARSEPLTSASILASITPGTAVEWLGTVDGASVNGSTGWHRVLHNGDEVYVHSSLLRDTAGPLPPPVQQTVPTAQAPAHQVQQPAAPPPPVQPIDPPPQSTVPPAAPAFTCNCSKTCPAMASCEEAYFQLNVCGCGRRDGDNDGIPCEDICLGG